MEIKNKKLTLLALFGTFFIDTLGATIVFPLFAPLFLDNKYQLFTFTTSLTFRSIMIGIFLGIFPLAQICFATLIGQLSDRWGRKRVLLLTSFMTVIGYILCGMSIQNRWIVLLFFSRIIMGAASGNLSLCLAAISDCSEDAKERVKNFSIGSLIVGAAFIIGPFLGGKLSDHQMFHVLNIAFPMWVGAGLAALNFLLILFALSETLSPVSKTEDGIMRNWKIFHQISSLKSVRKFLVTYFIYLCALNALIQFLPVFVVHDFQYTSSQIGNLFAFLGIFWVLGSLVLKYMIIGKFSEKKIMLFGAFVFACSMFLSLLFRYHNVIFLFLAIGVFSASFCWPICLNSISTPIPSHEQGKIQGITQAVQALAMIITPITMGFIVPSYVDSLFVVSGLLGLLLVVLVFFEKRTVN